MFNVFLCKRVFCLLLRIHLIELKALKATILIIFKAFVSIFQNKSRIKPIFRNRS